MHVVLPGRYLQNIICTEGNLTRKPTMWFFNRSDTNQAVQPQRTARNLKFWIKEEEGLYFPSSGNRPDQLPGYLEADLPLCLLVFS